MRITLKDEFTDKLLTINNVTAFYQEDNGTRVYTDLNGNRDMTTYGCWFVVSTETEGGR